MIESKGPSTFMRHALQKQCRLDDSLGALAVRVRRQSFHWFMETNTQIVNRQLVLGYGILGPQTTCMMEGHSQIEGGLLASIVEIDGNSHYEPIVDQISTINGLNERQSPIKEIEA